MSALVKQIERIQKSPPKNINMVKTNKFQKDYLKLLNSGVVKRDTYNLMPIGSIQRLK